MPRTIHVAHSPDSDDAFMFYALAEGKIDTGALITGQVGVDGVPQAFEDLASPERHAKILVEPWRA